MSQALYPLALELELPWSPDVEQEQRFVRTVKRILILLAILFVAIPFLPVPEKEYVASDKPVVKTKVILEPVTLTPPKEPEPKVKPKPKPKPKPKSKTKKKVENAPLPKVKNKDSIKKSQGLSELSNQLSALRGSLDLARMKKKNVSNNDGGKVVTSSRELLGKDSATKRSGGIEIDSELLSNKPTDLASYESTVVEGGSFAGDGQVSASSYSSYQEGRRDMESVRRMFESKKANVFAIYNKALLANPDLGGEFIFRLVILPDGSITKLELVSSELGIKKLEDNILERIKQIHFGVKKDVVATPIEYKFHFLPS